MKVWHVALILALFLACVFVIGVMAGGDFLTYIDDAGRICIRERDGWGNTLREVCR